MILTRPVLEKLNEDELRKKVLIPLFEAMGFQDVYDHHGGSLEKGKDIVMWKSGELHGRTNYAVVVKATRISGKASGKSSAAEVLFQLEQCFSDPFCDPLTSEKRKVHQCFVVSSKEIKKEAVEAISGVLNNRNLSNAITFINGDRLWQLMEEHLGPHIVWEKLRQVQEVLNEASPHYRMVVHMEGETTVVSLQPKYPGAEQEHPIGFQGKFVFPKTAEGKAKLEEFKLHSATGAPITLESDYIEKIEPPEFLTPFLAKSGMKPEKVVIKPRPSTQSHWVKVEVECEDGDTGSLDSIELKRVQFGTEEFTLSNEEQLAPWKFRFIFNARERKMTCKYTAVLDGANVKQVKEGLCFQRAMAKGGTLRIIRLDSGLTFFETPLIPGSLSPPEPHWIELVDKLVLIQNKIGIPLPFLGEKITSEEVNTIFETAKKLESGKVKLRDDLVTVFLDKEGAQKMLVASEEDKPLTLRFSAEEMVKIFGVDIPLGEVLLSCDQVHVPPENRDALRANINAPEQNEPIPIPLTPLEGHSFVAEYSKWTSSPVRISAETQGDEFCP